MSAKQLRKLQAAKDASHVRATEEESVSEVEDAPSKAGAPGFSLLVGSSDESEADGVPTSCEVEDSKPAVSESKGKKKKNKKHTVGTSKMNAKSEGDGVDAEDSLLDEAAAVAASELASRGKGKQLESCEAQSTPVLMMSRLDFSADREHRRLLGKMKGSGRGSGESGRKLATKARGAHEGQFAHHRKLFLVEPAAGEPWPRPQDCAKMVAESRGCSPTFSVCSTPEHSRLLHGFASIQMLHDPNEVQHFVMEHPFCVEALLVLSEIRRQTGQHEQAFDFLRRAVYAVECSFEAGFSPFAASEISHGSACLFWPRVRLDLPAVEEPSWAGWSWLAALWGYMLGLASRGLNRTAVEVCKLLLAATLPRDPVHALIHFDFFCLRADEYGLLIHVAQDLVPPSIPTQPGALVRLDCAMPNFAYSSALAGHLATMGGRGAAASAVVDEVAALGTLTVASIIAPCMGSQTSETDAEIDGEGPSQPHVALMRAMLLFPQVIRTLLDALTVSLEAPAPKGSPYSSSWSQLLDKRPLAGSSHMRHAQHFLVHALISDAYARRCAALWRGERTLRWLHACAARLTQMSESPLFDGELMEARRFWSQAPLSVEAALTADYKDFSTSEVDADRRAPPILERAMNSLVSSAAHGPAQALPAAGGYADHDEETQMRRALQMSLAAAEAQERRQLVEEQDAELRESLALDQARDAQGAADLQRRPVNEEAIAQLVDMGFSSSAAKEALISSGGDLDTAVSVLTS